MYVLIAQFKSFYFNKGSVVYVLTSDLLGFLYVALYALDDGRLGSLRSAYFSCASLS